MPIKPKISVITACYNSEQTIGESILSLKRQTWKPVEHVVIDGSSKDRTVDIARSTLDEGDIFVSEPDKGIYDALNKGIKRSSGEIVGFLHSDDFYAHDEVLAMVADCFVRMQADAVYGDLDYVDALDTSSVIRHWKSGEFQRKRLRYGWMPPHPTFFMRRSLYSQLGLFDTQFRIASDYDSVLRYLTLPGMRVSYIPEVLVKMRVGGASNGNIKQIISKSREDFAVMKKNGINPYLALPAKNVSKISQFFLRDK